jgi:exopolysaccharide production protein ExoZ
MDIVSAHRPASAEQSDVEPAAGAPAALNPRGSLERLHSIDLMRGLAASLVVLRHSVDEPFLIGAIGVDIFFVISGFVMAKVAVGRTPGAFLIDRAWRIFPIYWVALAICVAFRLIHGQGLTFYDSFSSILLVPNWFAFGVSYLGIAWTLLYELFFYSAVALGISLRNWRVPLLMFGAALVARPFVDNALVEFAGSPIMIEFLFGILIAVAPRSRRIGAALLVAAALFLAVYPNTWLYDMGLAMTYEPALYRVVLWGVPAAMFVYGALVFEESLKGRVANALLIVGTASYSIYLFHMIVIKMIVPGRPVLGFVMSIMIGIAMWWLVERRLLSVRPRQKLAALRQSLFAGAGRAASQQA